MKAALMSIPVLVSRNGTTHMGFELAEELGRDFDCARQKPSVRRAQC